MGGCVHRPLCVACRRWRVCAPNLHPNAHPHPPSCRVCVCVRGGATCVRGGDTGGGQAPGAGVCDLSLKMAPPQELYPIGAENGDPLVAQVRMRVHTPRVAGHARLPPLPLQCVARHLTSPPPGATPAQFCFPAGVHLSATRTPPSLHTFTLTNEKGERTFGFCARFHEPVDPRDLLASGFTADGWNTSASDPLGADVVAIETVVSVAGAGGSAAAGKTGAGGAGAGATAAGHKHRALYTPVCVCLLSPWPYLDLFRAVATECFELRDPRRIQALLVSVFDRLPPCGPQPGVMIQLSLPSGRQVNCYNPSFLDLPLIGFPLTCVRRAAVGVGVVAVLWAAAAFARATAMPVQCRDRACCVCCRAHRGCLPGRCWLACRRQSW